MGEDSGAAPVSEWACSGEVDCDMSLTEASVHLPGTLPWGQLFGLSLMRPRDWDFGFHMMSPQEGV